MATLLFSLAGFFLVIISLIAYLSTIPRAIVPENTGSLAIRLAIGVALALIALFLAISGEGSAGFFIYVPAIAAILFGGFFLWVLTLSKTPIGNIKVSLGDKILPFKAKTSNAESFDSKQLLGKRILFKFFRGGWCPYCAAELKAFNHMLPELEKYQISIMALSKDIPSQAAIQKTRDKLNFTLLSDPDLTVIRAYGLEHHKTLGQSKKSKIYHWRIGIRNKTFSFRSYGHSNYPSDRRTRYNPLDRPE